MKENWDLNWKDYYKILQVHPSAEPEVVKAAFERLARKYHPDINKAPNATQRMKDINEAYEILSDTEKRNRYDADYQQRMSAGPSGFKSDNNTSPPPPPPPAKPKPEVHPTIIRFTDVIPGETRKDSFIIKNSGGPYSKIWMNNPTSWLKIVSQRPLYSTKKLPLFVEIEVRGGEWGRTYETNLIVKLDDVETHVRVELQTRPKVEQSNQQTQEEMRKDQSSGVGGRTSGNTPPRPPPPPFSTSSPPQSSQTRPKSGVRSNAFNSVCQRCGKLNRVVFAQYNKNIGMGFSRREQSVKGYFCAKCVRVLFLQYFFTCLGLGWFGLISFFTNPFRMIFDVFQYIRAEIRLGGLGRTLVYGCVAGAGVFCLILAFSSHSTPNLPGPGATLLSIAVTPNPSIDLEMGQTEQFTATGTYSDGSKADISYQVTWNAKWLNDNTVIANISSAGLAAGIASGSTYIAASENGITSPAVNLTVILVASITTTPILSNISIKPGGFYPNLMVGYTGNFIATGTYSDGSVTLLTSQVTWHSSAPTIASISSSGLVTGIAPGITHITASMSGVTSNALTLTVGFNTTQTPTTVPTSAPSPIITLNPTSGSPGTTIFVNGFYFTPNGTVKSADIIFGGAPCTGTTFDIDGTGSVAFSINLNTNTIPGIYSLVVTDSSGKKASATFTVLAQTTSNASTTTTQTALLPTITLSPLSGNPGTQFTVTGYNFAPSDTVKSSDMTWNGMPLTASLLWFYGGAADDFMESNGTVTFVLTVPDDTSPGIYTLVVPDSSGRRASAKFTVN